MQHIILYYPLASVELTASRRGGSLLYTVVPVSVRSGIPTWPGLPATPPKQSPESPELADTAPSPNPPALSASVHLRDDGFESGEISVSFAAKNSHPARGGCWPPTRAAHTIKRGAVARFRTCVRQPDRPIARQQQQRRIPRLDGQQQQRHGRHDGQRESRQRDSHPARFAPRVQQ